MGLISHIITVSPTEHLGDLVVSLLQIYKAERIGKPLGCPQQAPDGKNLPHLSMVGAETTLPSLQFYLCDKNIKISDGGLTQGSCLLYGRKDSASWCGSFGVGLSCGFFRRWSTFTQQNRDQVNASVSCRCLMNNQSSTSPACGPHLFGGVYVFGRFKYCTPRRHYKKKF